MGVKSFSNQTAADKKLLKEFVDFHWEHYKQDAQYIPLLDYEYLGFHLIGMTGFFEPQNNFFNHADMKFFLAYQDGKVVGRCNAFVNHNFNKHWNEKTGFFGQFECIDDQNVANDLFTAAADWLSQQGMQRIRGPQNLPVNEATPGLLTEGFDTRPVIYYHYNKPYYENLVRSAGFEGIKRVKSWEVPVNDPMEPKLERLYDKIIKRYKVTLETWDQRPLDVRKKEMHEIYNDAWNDNFGFVPFEQKEFYSIVNDMMLVMDKGLFIFLYVDGEPAAFFGGVPNIFEKLKPGKICRRCDLIRAVKMLLYKNSVQGFRLGYLGVKKKFRRFGLDGVMLHQQKLYSQKKGYDYCDLGWVLEDNTMINRIIEMYNVTSSKTYTIFEKTIG